MLCSTCEAMSGRRYLLGRFCLEKVCFRLDLGSDHRSGFGLCRQELSWCNEKCSPLWDDLLAESITLAGMDDVEMDYELSIFDKLQR